MKNKRVTKEGVEEYANDLMEEVRKIRRLTEKNAKGEWELQISDFFKYYQLLNKEARERVLLKNTYRFGHLTWRDVYGLFIGTGDKDDRKWIEKQFREKKVNF